MPRALFKAETHAKLAEVIQRADAGEFADDSTGISAFFHALNAHLSTAENLFDSGARFKYHDMNLGHPGRVEVRAIRPQADMDVWLNQIELIESRINNHLRFIDRPLPLKPRVPIILPLNTEDNFPSHRYIPPVDPQLALKSFYEYVRQARLEWNDHRGYIWPPWFADGEVHKFEASNFFKNSEKQRQLRRRAQARMACHELLTP